MSLHPGYEVVVGLEVHAQILTESKLFCTDPAKFGAEPNTHVGPVTLGHPGTLPYLNHAALEHTVRMGLACGCSIAQKSFFARKNYFYPDLPKGYQISQHEDPICSDGAITIHTNEGGRTIRIKRIHLEEDAGKSVHDLDPYRTYLDYNRAGTPLMEIVTEPDLRSAEEAFVFLTEIRKRVRWIGVCDGNMEEGSLRCDANISIRPKGQTSLGTRVEVKNLNSIRNLKKAIEVEAARLIAIVESGGSIRQETRSFDASDDTTFGIRTKEDADDYRYFPEPDLPPFAFQEEDLARIRASLPLLPEAMGRKFVEDYGLSDYDAGQLCEERELSEYFLAVLPSPSRAKPLANWLLGPVRSYLNEQGLGWQDLGLQQPQWQALLDLVDSGRISFSTASQKLLPLLLQEKDASPLALAMSKNLLQDAGTDDIVRWVEETLRSMPDKVLEYQKGKKGLIGLFMGDVKKRSQGKADPRQVQEMLEKRLQNKS